MVTIQQEKLYPARDAAERIGITYDTLRHWMSEGRVDYVKRGGRNFMSESQIAALFQTVPRREGGAS